MEAQPRVPGPHTTRITILQTGRTNADRELRVEGDGGLWTKRLLDAEWTFVATGQPAGGTRTVPEAPTQSPREESLTAANPWPGTALALRDFNPDCEPAQLELVAGPERLALALPFHGGLDLVQGTRTLRGALLLPKGKTPWLSQLRALAGGQTYLEVTLEVTDAEVRLVRAPLPTARFPRAK